jgi:hypothetical protein
VPSAARQELADRLRGVQLARAHLSELDLEDLLAQLPPAAARACALERATMLLVREDDLTGRPLEAQVADSRRPLLVTDGAEAPYVLAPLVHPDRTIAVLRGEASGRVLDELDRDLLWTFASATAPVLHLATLAAIARAPRRPAPAARPPRSRRRRR